VQPTRSDRTGSSESGGPDSRPAESAPPFRRISVLGPGLIGGSVLRAARARFPAISLRGWVRRPEAVAALAADPAGLELASDSLEEAVAGADLLVLAMPVGAMAAVAERLPALPPRSDGRPVLVTDVGSVKACVMREIGPLVRARGGCFIGSHPMAGSEKVGLSHAEAQLFEGASVILTPVGTGDPATELAIDPDAGEGSAGDSLLADLRHFWEQLGGRVSLMEAERHDRLVAAVSHLPHLTAAALIRVALGSEPEGAAHCGGGLRDTTRVSGGPAEMWTGILADNREAVGKRLAALIDELSLWQEALQRDDRETLCRLLAEAKGLRETLG